MRFAQVRIRNDLYFIYFFFFFFFFLFNGHAFLLTTCNKMGSTKVKKESKIKKEKQEKGEEEEETEEGEIQQEDCTNADVVGRLSHASL